MTDVIDWFGTGVDAGAYSFLSNFYEVADGVLMGGRSYPTVEHAYQAAKTHEENWRHRIHVAPSPRVAKRLGRQAPLRDGWDGDRLAVMRLLLYRKFTYPYLGRQLMMTNERQLIEGNTWHDNFFGDCRCGRPSCADPGRNVLGRLLMEVRREIALEY